MTWVNLNNVYLPQAGGTVSGNLAVTGNLTINDKTGKGTTYNVASEITALRDSVSQLFHIEMQSVGSDDSLTAPTVSGYKFLCWFACVSVGWVGNAYIEDPTATSTRCWYVTQRWNSGGGTVHCFALYRHN